MKRFFYFAVFFTFLNGFSQPGLGFTYTHEEFEEEEDYYVNEYTVQHVFKRSPAEKAGLLSGDKIIKFHDALLQFVNPIAMDKIIKASPNIVELIISRNGVKKNFTITKADRSTYLNTCLEGNCTNGKGTFVDENAVTYTGTFKNRKKDGLGKALAVDGGYYDGQWKDNKRNGKGKYLSTADMGKVTSWSYEGDWKDDAMTGKGKVSYFGGSYYDGEMLDNNRNGTGKFVSLDKTVYEGIWKNNQLNGMGSITMPNGDKYSGIFTDSKLNGEVSIYTKATNTTTTAIYKDGVKQ